ncbi:MAG: calcium/proton exchanger [Acidobacteria bacterium]|jgi:Ca2+:H+ antiporter|nr:calcium/proton exchanger [Acidobacteriota bacterium]
MLRAIFTSPLNILLLAAPASWIADATAPGSPWVFITAAISLVPLAGLIGEGTEQLAARSGPAWGGFLNATFGNAAELIIALVALRNGHVALVKASISGSIVGNLLLVLGLSFFVGGLGRKSQKFHRTAATNTAAMLFLAVVALVMPAVFDLAIYGTLDVHPKALDRLSFSTALVLIVAYAGSLIYSFTAQRDLFRPGGEAEHRGRRLPLATAIGLLAIGTLLTTVQAEILIGAMEPALARFDFTELFVGVIVVALIGNAAEHYSAVTAARRDEMTLAVEIAVGSSAQIALFVAPALVLYSFAIGRPMTLLFNPFEITAITLSVLATAFVVVDGESNWVEGLQLLSVYLILALAFYFVPGS